MPVDLLMILRTPPVEVAAPWPCRTVAALPPRLRVMACEAPQRATLEQHPAVAAVLDAGQAPPAGLEPPLSEVERLFVAAFTAQGAKSGARRGEGLDWDAPGFQAPR